MGRREVWMEFLSTYLFLGRRVDGGPLVSCFDVFLLDSFNEILLPGKHPEAWRIALLVPIFQKGDPLMLLNYRGILHSFHYE